MIDQKFLREIFNYCPEQGVLTWKKSYRKILLGKPAGHKNKKEGYLVVKIKNKKYFAHRLIWIWMTGQIPNEIDHIDHDKFNNKWDNLRSVTRQQNAKNMVIRKNNTSGFTGVSWNKERGKWEANIRHDGKNIHLGMFSDIKAAIEKRMEANNQYGYHENHGL